MATPGERRYFVSHAGADKPFAISLRELLEGRAWVDLFEIPLGAIIVDEIANGIEQSTDFVLLWSAASSSSRWVQFEFNMAFVRHLEDEAIAIRIICLDETPTPLKFRPFLQARHVASPEQAADLLLDKPPRVPALRQFINRSEETGAFDSALYSSSKGFLWYCGLPGVGKRSVVREAAKRTVGDVSRVRTIEVREGTSFVELDLLVGATLGRELSPDTSSEEEARASAEAAIAEYAASGGIWVFEEAQHWLTDDTRPGPVLAAVFAALERSGVTDATRLAIFTSTRRPTLSGGMAAATDVIRVRGLSEDFGAALLRAHGARASDTIVRRAADELAGHPLSLEIVAGQLEDSEPNWEEYRAHAASGMVGSLDLDEAVRNVLERVAIVDGPLAAVDYADHLHMSADDFQDAIGVADSFSLTEAGDSGFLRLHPLVRDFFSRSFRRRDDFLDQVSDLASRSKELLAASAPGTTIYVDALVTTFKLLAWAGRYEEAIAIRQNLYGTLFETGVELYRQREYETARRYFEIVIESVDEAREAKLYLARTLAYTRQAREARRVAEEVTSSNPADAYAWYVRGRVEYILREFEPAIAYYERSLEIRAQQPTVLRDLGQARIRVRDWHGARAALERAIRMRERDPDSYLAYHYGVVLEHFGEIEEASRLVRQAIRRDPRNAIFHHRLGRIAQQRGRRDEAAAEFREALRLDPGYVEPALSLANIAADEGKIDEARQVLAKVRGRPNARAAVVLTIEATIDLAAGDIAAARAAIGRALAEGREGHSLAVAANIELAAIERGLVVCSDVSGLIRGYVEELRLDGAPDADRILARLAEICP